MVHAARDIHTLFYWVKSFKISGLVGGKKTSGSVHKEYDHKTFIFSQRGFISCPVNTFGNSKKGLCIDRRGNKFDIYLSSTILIPLKDSRRVFEHFRAQNFSCEMKHFTSDPSRLLVLRGLEWDSLRNWSKFEFI